MTVDQLAAQLPGIEVVRRWSQSLAVLDAILSADRGYRYFCFDEEFGPGQALASMRNGSGDEYSITFTSDGAFVRGFDHESPLSPFIQTPPALWPGLLTGAPAALATLADEPAFTLGGVPMMTVALWRLAGGRAVASRTDRLPTGLGEGVRRPGRVRLAVRAARWPQRKLPPLRQRILPTPAACRSSHGGHRAPPAHRGTRQRPQPQAVAPGRN